MSGVDRVYSTTHLLRDFAHRLTGGSGAAHSLFEHEDVTDARPLSGTDSDKVLLVREPSPGVFKFQLAFVPIAISTSELTDGLTTTPENLEVFKWNSTTGQYENQGQAFIGASEPSPAADGSFWWDESSGVSAAGAPLKAYRLVDSDDTQLLSDVYVDFDCTAGDITFTLLDEAVGANLELNMKKIDAGGNKMIIDGVVDDLANRELNTQYASIKIYSSGTKYGIYN